MRNNLIWGFVFLLLLVNVNAQVQDSAENDLRFELVSYSSSPLKPGERFVAEFSVTNIDEDLITELEIEFGERFPVSVENAKIINLGTLAPGEKRTFSQSFIVSPFARSEGGIFYQYSRREYELSGAGVFDVEISNLGKNVEFDAIRTEPEKLPPGQKGKIIIDFQNSADSTLEEITLRLNVTSPFTISGTTNEKRIGSLISKESQKIEFDVIVDPDAEVGSYTLPLDITFYDNLRNLFTKSVNVGIVVDSKPDYEVFVEESDTLIYGTTPSITIAFSNTGTSDIKFLTMELLDTENYFVVSNSKSYLGNLEPDDFETSRFDISLENCFGCDDEVPLKVKLNFKDSFNNDIEEVVTIYEKAYYKNKAVALGLAEQGGSISSLIVYLLLIIFLYSSYKEYRKSKDLALALKRGLKKTALVVVKLLAWIVRRLNWRYIKTIPRRIWNFFNKLR